MAAMDITDLVTPETILSGLRCKDKKQLLQEMSGIAAPLLSVPVGDLFEALLQRERLGSTAVGRGIAIPHCRLSRSKSVRCLFARLDTPLEFAAPDGEPVDLVFLLVAPEDAGADHLKALACISRTMRDPALCSKLRSVKSTKGIYAVLSEYVSRPAA